jgi:hypothetical protein
MLTPVEVGKMHSGYLFQGGLMWNMVNLPSPTVLLLLKSYSYEVWIAKRLQSLLGTLAKAAGQLDIEYKPVKGFGVVPNEVDLLYL